MCVPPCCLWAVGAYRRRQIRDVLISFVELFVCCFCIYAYCRRQFQAVQIGFVVRRAVGFIFAPFENKLQKTRNTLHAVDAFCCDGLLKVQETVNSSDCESFTCFREEHLSELFLKSRRTCVCVCVCVCASDGFFFFFFSPQTAQSS